MVKIRFDIFSKRYSSHKLSSNFFFKCNRFLKKNFFNQYKFAQDISMARIALKPQSIGMSVREKKRTYSESIL